MADVSRSAKSHRAAVAVTAKLRPSFSSAGYRGMTELREYFLGLLQQKRKSPAEDVLSSLANPAPGEPGETVVPDRDIAGLFMALIVAGHEAMTGLIGNG